MHAARQQKSAQARRTNDAAYVNIIAPDRTAASLPACPPTRIAPATSPTHLTHSPITSSHLTHLLQMSGCCACAAASTCAQVAGSAPPSSPSQAAMSPRPRSRLDRLRAHDVNAACKRHARDVHAARHSQSGVGGPTTRQFAAAGRSKQVCRWILGADDCTRVHGSRSVTPPSYFASSYFASSPIAPSLARTEWPVLRPGAGRRLSIRWGTARSRPPTCVRANMHTCTCMCVNKHATRMARGSPHRRRPKATNYRTCP